MDLKTFNKIVEDNRRTVSLWPQWMQDIVICGSGCFIQPKDKKMKLNKQEELKRLRCQFKYNEDGTPDIYSYGEFKGGLTNEEIDNYLKVRWNLLTLTARFRNKYNKQFGCQTAASIKVNGQDITLFYRHDVLQCADAIFNNKPNLNWD